MCSKIKKTIVLLVFIGELALLNSCADEEPPNCDTKENPCSCLESSYCVDYSGIKVSDFRDKHSCGSKSTKSTNQFCPVENRLGTCVVQYWGSDKPTEYQRYYKNGYSQSEAENICTAQAVGGAFGIFIGKFTTAQWYPD